MQSLAALTDPEYKGRLAIYDYYLPVIGMAALALGKKTADLTEADLPAIKDLLLKMKANAKLVGEVTASQTALHRRGGHSGRWRRMGHCGACQGKSGARFFHSQGRRHSLVAVSRDLRRRQEQGSRPQIHPICAVARRSGPPRNLLLLLGHAGQQQGHSDRRSEADSALRRA